MTEMQSVVITTAQISKETLYTISFSFEGSIIYCDIKDDCLVEIFYQNMK